MSIARELHMSESTSQSSDYAQFQARELPLMTVRELAKYLNINESTVYKMVTRTEIPVVRLGPNGRMLRFKWNDIELWIAERQK
jgi:excisionase family DNA binding protein